MSTKKKSKKKQNTGIQMLRGQAAWFSQSRLHLILLFTIGFLIYANTFGHDYTQDDAIVITDNMFTTDGIKGIGGILGNDTFFGFFKDAGKANLVAGGRYRPFSLVTFAIEYSLFGQNPNISHVINALFFGFTVVMLYLTLLLLLARIKNQSQVFFISLVAALIFAVHPIHTEAVANIKGRDEILALLGSLAALYFAVQAIRKNSYLFNIWGSLCLFLALMSKENAITFLAIIPLSYYFFTKTTFKNGFIQLLPYLGVTFLFLFIRTSILGLNLGGSSNELMNNPFLRLENGIYTPIGFVEQLATVIYTLGKYLVLLIFPHPLTHDYYPRHIALMSWSNPLVIASVLSHLALLWYGISRALKRDLLAFGILFYLLTLSIVSNVVFPIGTNMAERLLFMPSVGFCLGLAVLLYRLGDYLSPEKQMKAFAQLKVPMILALLFCIALATKTLVRNTAWKDNYTLFTTDIKTSKNSAKLRNAVGGEIVTQFGTAPESPTRDAKLQEAIGHLEEAIRIHPYYKNAYLLKGNAHFYLKQYDSAIATYQQALQLDPNYEDAQRNLGVSLRDAGRYFGEQVGDLAKAQQYLLQAEQYLPEDYETLRLLGVAYGIQGNNQQAINYFQKAANASPDIADAWYNLGTSFLAIGDQAQGEQFRQKAIQMDPAVLQRMNQ